MMSKVGWLVCIWVVCAAISLAILNNDVKEESLEHYSGVVREASCISSRTFNALDLVVSRDDGRLTREFLLLPASYECDSANVLPFQGEPVRLSRYENDIVGVTIGSTVILDVKDGIKRANNRSTPLLYTLFVAIAASIVVIIKGRWMRA